MRDRYEPSTDPEPWPAVPPAYPAWRAGEENAGPDWDPYCPAEFGGPADEARHQGLRRLSRLTWQATGLSAVAAVGFAAVFASSARAQAPAPAPARPISGPATASGTPSPGPTHKHHKHHKGHKKPHHEAGPITAPDTPAPAAPAAAPSPTLAPPTTAPAPPPPSSAPPPTNSSGSVAG
jgi:hypothetical protein